MVGIIDPDALLLEDGSGTLLLENGSDELALENSDVDFLDLIGDLNALKHYAVIVNPYDPDAASEDTRYFSDNGLVTSPTDDLANQYFEPRLVEAFQFNQSLIDGDRLRGLVKSDFGQVELASGRDTVDGGLIDDLVNFGWDGRDIQIALGREDLEYGQWGIIFLGQTKAASLTESRLTITLSDLRGPLDINIQENEYAGTGGVEGGSDLEGKPKPLCYGKVRNIEPIYLGVISGNHTYQVHDGEINDVPVVRSDGVELTQVGSAPSAGEYSVDTANGTFELGGSTLDTIITCDVEGAAPSGTWLQTVGDIIQEIVTDKGGFGTEIFESGTVTDLNSTNNALVGVWIPENDNILSVVSSLLNDIGAYMVTTRRGEFRLGRIDEPKATADFEFVGRSSSTATESDQILDIKRKNTKRPLKGVRLRYQRNFSRLRTNDIAGSVSEADRTFLVNEYRVVSDTDNTITTKHPLAQTELFETNLDSKTDAEAEATRLLDLFKEDREIFDVTLKAQPLAIDLGQTVKITDDRFNLSSGKNFLVIGLRGNAASGKTVLTLYG